MATWIELKEERIAARKADADRYFQKALSLTADGDYEAAQRFIGYALYQAERIFAARKGFKLQARLQP